MVPLIQCTLLELGGGKATRGEPSFSLAKLHREGVCRRWCLHPSVKFAFRMSCDDSLDVECHISLSLASQQR